MQTRRKILFVDEDTNVLEGLRRSFRDLRREWALAFAKSGKEAMEILRRVPFDAVISDITVPGMEGGQLLQEVMEKHPSVVRIVLAGDADQATALRSMQPAHQYLTKPYDAEKLKRLLVRAMALRDRLVDKKLETLVARLDTLPSMPALYMELMEEMTSENASIRRVGDIISRDVGMTAKILQLVNSAFFGVLQRVESPAQAVSLLGLETIQGLVLSVHIFSCYDGDALAGLWDHSMLVGGLAKEIARKEKLGSEQMGHAFMGGILHDAGQLILASNLPDRYRQVLALAADQGGSRRDAELQVFGTTHAEVGAYLFGLWGLPDAIVEAIAFHHTPAECPVREVGALALVHAADAVARRIEAEARGEERADAEADEQYLAWVGLEGRFQDWVDHCTPFFQQQPTGA